MTRGGENVMTKIFVSCAIHRMFYGVHMTEADKGTKLLRMDASSEGNEICL
jgi:hypothetical protein